MSVTFYPYRQDAAGIWRITARDESRDEFPNFANGRASALLNELGFGEECLWNAEPVALDLFEQAVFLARTGLDGKPSAATESRVLPGPGMTVIEFGQWEGRDNERLDLLTALVAIGRASGATHIGWD